MFAILTLSSKLEKTLEFQRLSQQTRRLSGHISAHLAVVLYFSSITTVSAMSSSNMPTRGKARTKPPRVRPPKQEQSSSATPSNQATGPPKSDEEIAFWKEFNDVLQLVTSNTSQDDGFVVDSFSVQALVDKFIKWMNDTGGKVSKNRWKSVLFDAGVGEDEKQALFAIRDAGALLVPAHIPETVQPRQKWNGGQKKGDVQQEGTGKGKEKAVESEDLVDGEDVS